MKWSFTSPKYLTSHIRAHINEGPYQCNVCNKTFQNAAHLAAHAQSHEKALTCYICEMVFTSPESLTLHIRAHINEGPYHCDFCQKFFSNKASLTQHLIWHSWNTLWKCDICYKTFSKEFNMKCHTCEENGTFYGDRFIRNSYQKQQDMKRLRSQKKGNQSDKSAYLCLLCEKSFASTKELLEHGFETKIGEGPKHKCCHCKKSMSTIGGLRRHMHTHGEKSSAKSKK